MGPTAAGDAGDPGDLTVERIEWSLFVLKLCDRFRCLPSALFAEDQQLLQLLEIEALTRLPDQLPGEGGHDDHW